MIRKLFVWFIKRYNLASVIEDLQKQEKVNRCVQSVTNNGAVFLPEASVFNEQNDSSKIIVGKGTHIRGSLLIFKFGGSISIGSNCYVGEGTRIWSGESISIGNNVLISHNVNIVDNNAHEIDSEERAKRYEDLVIKGHWQEKGNIISAAVIIEDYAWISFNATILKGVKIGKGAIVAAGSLVTKDVPPFVLVAGNPASVIRTLQ